VGVPAWAFEPEFPAYPWSPRLQTPSLSKWFSTLSRVWTCRDSIPTPDRLPSGLVFLVRPGYAGRRTGIGGDRRDRTAVDRVYSPRLMLEFEFVRGKASYRKLRLFGCACCRRIWELLPDQANRDLVTAVEDRPDGTPRDPELSAAIVASSVREHELSRDGGFWAVKFLGRSLNRSKFSPFGSIDEVAQRAAQRMGGTDKSAAEREAQAHLVREIMGNPFHPLPPRPEAVAPLAEQVY